MIEPAFRILLLNNAPLSLIVKDRVYHNVREENERRACVVLRLVSKVHEHNLVVLHV